MSPSRRSDATTSIEDGGFPAESEFERAQALRKQRTQRAISLRQHIRRKTRFRAVWAQTGFMVVAFPALIGLAMWKARSMPEEEGAVVRRQLQLTPPNVFSETQMQHGALLLHALCMLYMFIGIAVICDEYFVSALELISERLQISDDVAGATFMAAGGSAPEFATSMLGVFIFTSDVGFGPCTHRALEISRSFLAVSRSGNACWAGALSPLGSRVNWRFGEFDGSFGHYSLRPIGDPLAGGLGSARAQCVSFKYHAAKHCPLASCLSKLNFQMLRVQSHSLHRSRVGWAAAISKPMDLSHTRSLVRGWDEL
eukprot:2472953-Pleurochrysis_carterae.AAC.1